jgi:hypothetical protein
MSDAKKPDTAILQWMTANIANDAKLGLSLHSYEGVVAARLLFVRNMTRKLDARTIIRCASAAGLRGHTRADTAAESLAVRYFPLYGADTD